MARDLSGELAEPAQIDRSELDGRWSRMERVGSGASSVVWRGRSHSGGEGDAAIKVANPDPVSMRAVAAEARLLARVGRRWGPKLLDAGPGYLVTEWVEGDRLELGKVGVARDRLAAVLAHAVGRGLEELHEAGIRHGDVKPANVLWAGREPTVDAADARVATLIDLGLATESGEEALGATPRYSAPELSDRGEAASAADLWSLGLMLAELLDDRVASAARPAEVVAAWDGVLSEPARWVQALMAPAPGGRPSASWLAMRAAKWLGLTENLEEVASARVARVRRAYLAERRNDVDGHAVIPASIGEPARSWLQAKIDGLHSLPLAREASKTIEPLGIVRTARWLVRLVGASAAAWPLGALKWDEGAIVARAAELASAMAPSAWTFDDFASPMARARATWKAAPGPDRIPSLVRELAQPSPDAAAIELGEDETVSGQAPTTLALLVASALLRVGEAGRAWAALSRADGPEVEALRAEVARRRGDISGAEKSANLALAASDNRVSSRGRATLARLAWDRGDLEAAEAVLVGGDGAGVAEQRALISWKRGEADEGGRIVEAALSGSLDAEGRARLEAIGGILELSRGQASRARASFSRAVESAVRSGSVVEEATYLTSEAAAATDCGAVGRALESATRAALLWERLARPAQAARAWLARAASLAAIGAQHSTDEAACEARARAIESHDVQAAAYALWARVEVRTPGDESARAWAIQAARELGVSSPDDQARALARLLLWAPLDATDARFAETDERIGALSPAARWEWWGARAAMEAAGIPFLASVRCSMR
jgi:hypothetical protein